MRIEKYMYRSDSVWVKWKMMDSLRLLGRMNAPLLWFFIFIFYVSLSTSGLAIAKYTFVSGQILNHHHWSQKPAKMKSTVGLNAQFRKKKNKWTLALKISSINRE